MNRIVKGDAYRRTVVCVDSYENGIASGRLYNRFFPNGKLFFSIAQFLLEMEDMLDQANFPQAYTKLRSFHPPANTMISTNATECTPGVCATFVVCILFRQNASWQGSILWQEKRQEQHFRSVLELIHLLDSALCCKPAYRRKL